MQARTRAVFGALLLALAVLMAVFVPEARTDPASALYVVLFGLAGVLYLASNWPPAGLEPHHPWGAGEASLGLAFFAMAFASAFGGLPWVVALIVGTVVGVAQVWQGTRRIRGTADPGGSWSW